MFLSHYFKKSEPKIDLNALCDLFQKTAWRLVRAAEDMFGSGKGDEKRAWCVRRFKEIFKDVKDSEAEDYVRAAFMNLKVEMGVIDRKY